MGDLELITVEGQAALAELERLRSQFAATGLYPLLIGDAEEYERVLEGMEESAGVAEILEESRGIDVARWFAETRQEQPELYEAEEADWPGSPGDMGIITHLDLLSGKPKDEVTIALLKVASPWEVFAHLNWGGWNDCPFPAAHCAIHRDWASRYGAEVASVTGDVVQCRVARPPTDRATSLELAREQHVYCYDIVEQGTQTIAALAAGLLGSKTWYFWWD